jgi:hypothetical protein
MTITILPHQIFIIPQAFESIINKEIFAQFRIYNNDELRYEIKIFEYFLIKNNIF